MLRRLLAFVTGRAGSGRDPLGPEGERIAARTLKGKGLRVLERNVRTPVGEADLVCLAADRRTIVIVEVKTRRRLLYSGVAASEIRPEESVGASKQRKLLRIAQVIAHQRGWTDRPLRIDVVAVETPAKGKPIVRHHENAVTA